MDRRYIEEKNPVVKTVKYVGLGILILILFFGTFYTVGAGHRGILLTFGKPSMTALDEGFHMKIPIVQKAVKMEVRTQKIETTALSASKDLQDIKTTIALNFHLSPNEVPVLFRDIGGAYRERIINPTIQESVKAITATFTAEELITRRPEVRTGIQEQLRERLSKYYIVVDDFNIINFQFSEEFGKAIEAKVTAEQLMLKASRDLERIRIEKEQRITQAQAEAEALRLQKLEITPDLVRLRQIEVQREAIAKWDGILPKVTGGAMPFIDLRSLEEQTIAPTE